MQLTKYSSIMCNIQITAIYYVHNIPDSSESTWAHVLYLEEQFSLVTALTRMQQRSKDVIFK